MKTESCNCHSYPWRTRSDVMCSFMYIKWSNTCTQQNTHAKSSVWSYTSHASWPDILLDDSLSLKQHHQKFLGYKYSQIYFYYYYYYFILFLFFALWVTRQKTEQRDVLKGGSDSHRNILKQHCYAQKNQSNPIPRKWSFLFVTLSLLSLHWWMKIHFQTSECYKLLS